MLSSPTMNRMVAPYIERFQTSGQTGHPGLRKQRRRLDAPRPIWWNGYWRLGHREKQRVTYMAACADDRPPTHEWNVVDSRE